MRKSGAVLVLACALALAVVPALAKGPWEAKIWQFGVETDALVAGNEFQVRGEGFHNRVLPVKVCVFDSQCQLAEPDGSGRFVVSRTMATPGNYEIRVFQAKDPHISEWRLKASCPITVGN